MKRLSAIVLLSAILSGFFLIAVQAISARGSDDQAARRLRLGGKAMSEKLRKKVAPVYPALARQSKIEGAVRLHIIVGTDGLVKQLEVMSGHPLLVQASLDAVRQWQYEPTQLNGAPVEVDSTVDVVFQLHN